VLVAAVVGAGMVIAGCSSSGSKTASPPPTSGAQGSAASATTVAAPTPVEGTAITIKGFAFQPPELRAKVGDTITVTNDDGTDHTLSAVDGSFTTGRFSTGTKSIKVTAPGRFEFKCEVHGFMPHGFIQVSA